MRASRIHDGGKSSSTTSDNGLKTLNECRPSADQNAITVSIGGQPGSPHATSATMMVHSGPSENRRRVQSFKRVPASAFSVRRFGDFNIMAENRSKPALFRKPILGRLKQASVS